MNCPVCGKAITDHQIQRFGYRNPANARGPYCSVECAQATVDLLICFNWSHRREPNGECTECKIVHFHGLTPSARKLLAVDQRPT